MKKITVATHDGIFHADEIFALTVLKLYLEKENKQIEIVRTRDLEKIFLCDMAVDVGGEYSKAKNKYDHHQKEKPKSRPNGIPYASFGLIWKHLGRKITINKEVWEAIEKKLVVPIDALDNGIAISTPTFKGIHEFSISQMMAAIGTFYGDDSTSAFDKALEFAKLILVGEITKTQTKIAGEKIVTQEIIKQGEPEVLVLETYTSWDIAVSKYKNVKLVVFPNKEPGRWCIQTARDNPEVFDGDRATFPKSWRGLSNEELTATSEVPDSVFCHTGGWFAVAKTKAAAVELAKKAINHQEN